jgi:N-methylhydantoinase A
MAIHVAVDIGGTSTDVVARKDEAIETAKVPSTPANLVEGVREGLTAVIEKTADDRAGISRFVHGTTAGTNAVIEQEGGTVGLLMTEGFRDTLAIGRQKRRDMYNLFLDPQAPTFLSPRRRRFGIGERVDKDGNILRKLDDEQVLDAVDTLVDEQGVESIGICYLFSFANSTHEEQTEALIKEHYPDVYVSRSSEINPKFREYERLVVTAFDAYLRPVIEDYTERMIDMLDDEGLECELQIMQSRGGITNAEIIIEKPVRTALSGPAAAVAGANDIGSQAGFENLITFDMGGTSSDVSVIEDGQPRMSAEGELIKYPLRTQMIDIDTIGAGGGSIAWIDKADSLHTGPKSAGADPGPACYQRGGTEPTLTDASVILGYLNPDRFAGGSIQLDPDLAEDIIGSEIADPIGYSVVEAVKGIHEIANAKMAEQLRLNTVQRGIDPRNFSLFAMGGAGPLHAGRLAERLGIPRVIVPTVPGVLSARGLLSADIEHDHEQTFTGIVNDLEPDEVERAYEDLIARGDEAMAREGVPMDEVTVTRQADMRYQGQSWEIELELPSESVTAEILGDVNENFHDRHDEVYGHQNEDSPVEFVNLRVIHSYGFDHPEGSFEPTGDSVSDAERPSAMMHFVDRDEPIETPVYDRYAIPLGTEFEGPAVIEQNDTTTVVYPGQTCTVDEQGNLIITIAE